MYALARYTSPMLPKRILPGPGQESVWDYPRPPRVEASTEHILVMLNGVTLVDTRRSMRVLETSHPPTYYFPPEDVQWNYFTPSPRNSFCEWKGQASYYTLRVGEKVLPDVAWFYPTPSPGFELIQNYIALYPGRMDKCTVDGESVTPQPGQFYGGWITSKIVGPFKGEPGTSSW